MAVATLEKCGSIINQICSMATSELGTVDTEALPSQQMLDFVFSSVEKFVGQIDAPIDIIFVEHYEFLECFPRHSGEI